MLAARQLLAPPCAHKQSLPRPARQAHHQAPRRHQASPAVAAEGTSGGSGGSGARHTCRSCKRPFSEEENHGCACRYHTALYSGGELSKAIGFCRESAAPEHQLMAVMGRRGLLRFWDCCGAEEADAPGCTLGRHVSYDEPEP